jgi:putative PIN family toxin of toxin-antitoxin system
MYVLDTNIFVAAFWSSRGASYQLLKAVFEGELDIAVSVALALEYEAVLKRPEMRAQSWARTEELDALLDLALASATLVMPIRTRLRPALPDASDDMVLECAVQSGAEAIVTMNIRDFGPAQDLYRTDILSPGQALERLKGTRNA